MDALHRLVLGLAIALAHIGGWNAIVPAPSCLCAQASVACAFTGCLCKAEPTERREAPARDNATVAPPTPRVPAPDRLGLEAWSTDRVATIGCAECESDVARTTHASPFAFLCVWRT